MGYIQLNYRPKETDVICEFYIEPAGIPLQKAAEHVAAESSIGTWTEVSTMSEGIRKKGAKVFFIDGKNNEVKIAYPIELFEKGNIPSILSGVAGNIFGMKVIKNIRLQDIHFPKSLVRSFNGPEFGIDGIRKMLKIRDRPLLGTIIKPKLGLPPEKHANVAFEAWLGGCDLVKDDENLTDQDFNHFKKRVLLTLKAKEKAEKITGEKKAYMPNITAETFEMLKRAEFVKSHGGNYLMVDILTLGWAALQTIRNAHFKLPLHAHRAGHAAITRNKKHGISMLTIAKIARLIGVDSLHIGTAVGKMEGPASEIIDIEEEIEKNLISNKKHTLEQKWYNLKPVFAVCSGGLYPALVPDLIKLLGKNIFIQMGGGIHGHPYGTKAGAKAARQAIDAVMQNKSLKEYSKTHKELRIALEHWKG